MIGVDSEFVCRYIRDGFVKAFSDTSEVLEEWVLNATGYRLNFCKDIFKYEGKNYIKYKNGKNSASQLFINELNDKRNDYMTSNECISNIDLMFAAGFDTTSSTIEYIITLLPFHPEIQEKIYQELLKSFFVHLSL